MKNGRYRGMGQGKETGVLVRCPLCGRPAIYFLLRGDRRVHLGWHEQGNKGIPDIRETREMPSFTRCTVDAWPSPVTLECTKHECATPLSVDPSKVLHACAQSLLDGKVTTIAAEVLPGD